MTTVTVYSSTDGSAPVLTGQAGALTTLLDAVLVNGYGAKSAAGWTIAYTTTNKRVYRMNTTDGTGFYLYVDDASPGAAGAQEARATGFQAASGLGLGTGQFPTLGQMAIGIGATVIRKSATANSTARPWVIVADDTCFYMWIENGDFTSPTATTFFMFGDIFSMNGTSDVARCAIIGRCAENQSTGTYDWFMHHCGPLTNASAVLNQVQGAHFLAANAQNVGGSIVFGKHIDNAKLGGGFASAGVTANPGITPIGSSLGNSGVGSPMGANYGLPSGTMAAPNPVDGGFYLSPIWVHHNMSVRGYLKGLWAPMHHLALGHGDTFSGSGALAGKTFLAQWGQGWYNNASAFGVICVETSSTWS